MFGLLNINKPQGWTSRDVVNHITRMVGRKIKVGHAGTLDPLARGVLIVCVGNATKLVPWIHNSSKSYQASFQLGVQSPTDDIESECTPVALPEITEADIVATLPAFTGRIRQVPPIFSAVKIGGERAYHSARKGIEIDIPEREVLINSLTLDRMETPNFTLNVECGTGTYMRSLGRDIARTLGTEAVMTDLIRTNIGKFHIDHAVDIEKLSRSNIVEFVLNPAELFEGFPEVTVDDWTAQRIIWGQSIANPQIDDWASGDDVILKKEDGHFLGIAKVEGPRLLSQVVFIPAAHKPMASPADPNQS